MRSCATSTAGACTSPGATRPSGARSSCWSSGSRQGTRAQSQIASAGLLLFHGEPAGTPLKRLGIEWIDGGGGRAAGFEPGTYALLFDVEPYAPRVLRGVALGAGATSLGEVLFERGSTVEVTLKAPPSVGIDEVGASAEALEGPPCTRTGVYANGVARVRGLAAGRHLVRVNWSRADGGGGVREREVVVDGVHDAAVEVEEGVK